jgi:hypothetical protein
LKPEPDPSQQKSGPTHLYFAQLFLVRVQSRTAITARIASGVISFSRPLKKAEAVLDVNPRETLKMLENENFVFLRRALHFSNVNVKACLREK